MFVATYASMRCIVILKKLRHSEGDGHLMGVVDKIIQLTLSYMYFSHNQFY